MKRRLISTLMCLLAIIIFVLTARTGTKARYKGTSTRLSTSTSEAVSVEDDPYNPTTSVEMSPEQRQELELQDSILALESDEPYSKLITKIYPEKSLFEDYLLHLFLDLKGSRFNIPIIYNQDKYPIECLRKTSDNTVYVVNKTTEGGLAYRFFEKGAYGWDNTYSSTHNIYVKKKLSHSQFEKVKVGNSIKKVEKIDPVTKFYKIEEPGYHNDTFATVHLLTDGVMVFHFEKSIIDYKVTAIEYFDDYIISFGDGDITYDCRIRPEDFIS